MSIFEMCAITLFGDIGPISPSLIDFALCGWASVARASYLSFSVYAPTLESSLSGLCCR